MFSAILIILVLCITDLSRTRSSQFKSLTKHSFWIFVVIFLLLMKMGGKHVESPYIVISQIITFFYFLFFIFIIPTLSLLETTYINIFNFFNDFKGNNSKLINNSNSNMNRNIRLYSTFNKKKQYLKEFE